MPVQVGKVREPDGEMHGYGSTGGIAINTMPLQMLKKSVGLSRWLVTSHGPLNKSVRVKPKSRIPAVHVPLVVPNSHVDLIDVV